MAVINRIRGSGQDDPVFSKLLPNFLKNGSPFGTMLFMGAMMLITNDLLAAGAVAAAWFVFELFAWGKWIGTVPKFFDASWQDTYNQTTALRKDGKDIGIHQIASIFFKETKNFTMYCITCLFLRGVVWFAPIYAILVGFGLVTIPIAVVSTAIVGILFPISFIIGYKINKKSYWATGEYIYGAAQGAVLATSMIMTGAL